jgi:L-arabinose transport system substrate-binding protein
MVSRLGSGSLRALFVALLVLAAAVAITACGGDGSDSTGGGDTTAASTEDGGDKPLLVSLNKLGTTGYMIDLADGFEEKAAEVGAEARVIDVELDSEKTITELQNAISSGAAGIAITVPDQKLGPRVIELAEQAGIPLIATNDTIENQAGEPAPFVGYDNAEMGELVGEEAAKQLNEAGWVADGDKVGLLSIEVQTLSVCQDRTDASTEVLLKEVDGLKESDVKHVPYDGTSESALKSVPGVVTANPEIDHWVIYACSDDGVAGALRALEQAGVPAENSIGVGLGGYVACDEWKSGRTTGFTAALWLDGADVGGTAVEELYAAATDGTPLPESVFAPTEIVTPDSYEAAGIKC